MKILLSWLRERLVDYRLEREDMERFKWQHIMFEDGSNPYVCMNQKAFKWMQRRYMWKLVKIKEGFWLIKNDERKISWEELYCE